ncbi:MAG TPA: carboxypeptidase-like regulatory domain-containing protein [Longimicrobium sp.]
MLLLILLGAAAPARGWAQVRTDRIEGIVIGTGAQPIAGATVLVVRAPDRQSFTGTTDASGGFSITIPQGTGDYLLHVSAPEWNSYRQRVSATGDGPLPRLEIQLTPVVVNLAPVVASTQRLKPQRSQGIISETGAAEHPAAGVVGAVNSAHAGNLASVAATVPGVTPTADGFAVLGLAGQNQTRLNGLDFSGAEIPRDVRTRTRVATTTYDPARGGFGGAEVSVDLAPGGGYTFRRAHVGGDIPGLGGNSVFAAPRTGGGLRLSTGTEGELPGRFNYNAGIQITRESSGAYSIAELRRQLVGSGQASQASVNELGSTLSALGVPSLSGAGAALSPVRATFLGRIDHDPRSDRTWGVVAYLDHSTANAPGLSVAAPGQGGRREAWNGTLQGTYSFYFGREYLNETQSAISFRRSAVTPVFAIPRGIVALANDSVQDGAGAFAFGGNSLQEGRNRSWTWETTNTTQWYTAGSRHKPKLYTQLRVDEDSRSAGGDLLGTFTYPSLAALAEDRPSSFTRVLSDATASGGEVSGVVSVGDLWRVNPSLQLLYGARLEESWFTARPAFNPQISSLFGARTDRAPGGVHVSPRIGFTWAYTPGSPPAPDQRSVLGTRVRAPVGVLRGGFGEFRLLLPADLLAGTRVFTGLPGGAERVRCVGPAVPTPDWAAFLAGAPLPSTCGDGSRYVDTAPSVELFSSNYSAARSWRGNLAWTSRLLRRVDFTVEGVYSLNLDQSGTRDLNFRGEPRFTLPAESGRPFFSDPADVDPATGASSAASSRISTLFGPVSEHRSDLRSTSRQVTLTLTPDLNFSDYFFSVSYTLADSRAQARGFDAPTAGNPSEREWAPGDWDVRHQVIVQAGVDVPDWFSFTLFGRISSGLPYTPVVAGDVNGDGYANDRAFVFDAGRHASLATLLQGAPAGAAACLRKQIGRIAERNSCRGPWSAMLNARLQVAPPLPHTARRATVALEIANPLGALDQLVHGGDDLHGWGTQRSADPVLYTVRGFDPSTREFDYAVNRGFGRSKANLGDPFRISFDVSIDLSRPLPEQQMERSLKSAHGRLPADSLLRRYARSVPDIYDQILIESDSLLLTPAQSAALKEAQKAYRSKLDVVWRSLVDYLAALPEHYNGAGALQRQEAALDSAWEISRLEGATIKSVLSPLQLQMVPGQVGFLINSPGPVHIRTYIQ